LHDGAPSDYDTDHITEKLVSVTYDDNEAIRDALKRELLMLSSITNRGEFTSSEECDIVINIVMQLEALYHRQIRHRIVRENRIYAYHSLTPLNHRRSSRRSVWQ